MSKLPECIKCGCYVNWGYVLCWDHVKELYDWILDILDQGLTDDLKCIGIKFVSYYNKEQLWEEEIEKRFDNPLDPHEQIQNGNQQNHNW